MWILDALLGVGTTRLSWSLVSSGFVPVGGGGCVGLVVWACSWLVCLFGGLVVGVAGLFGVLDSVRV